MELRFGQVHRKHVHQVEFKHCNQKPNETLQGHEADVARLARLSYPGAADKILEQLSTDQIVDGIRCLDALFPVCMTVQTQNFKL